MSQEKVEKHKKEKANRKQIMKREKRKRVIEYIIGIIIVALILVWIGFSVYQKVQPQDAATTTTSDIDFSDLEDVLNATDTEADVESDVETSDDTETETSADAETEVETETTTEAE